MTPLSCLRRSGWPHWMDWLFKPTSCWLAHLNQALGCQLFLCALMVWAQAHNLEPGQMVLWDHSNWACQGIKPGIRDVFLSSWNCKITLENSLFLMSLHGFMVSFPSRQILILFGWRPAPSMTPIISIWRVGNKTEKSTFLQSVPFSAIMPAQKFAFPSGQTHGSTQRSLFTSFYRWPTLSGSV